MKHLVSADRSLFIAISLAFILIYGDSTVLSIALPSIQKTFNASNDNTFWVMNSYMLVRAVLVLASGRLSDLFSHIRTFVFGLVILTLASCGCALSVSVFALILFRCAQGIGATFIFVAGMSLITAHSSKSSMARKIGFVLSLGLASMAIAPVVGGLLVKYQSWTWIFVLNAIIGTMAILMSIPAIRQGGKPAETRSFDYIGFVLSVIFTACITVAFENSNTWGFASSRFIITLFSGIIAFILFITVETRQSHPVVNLRLFKSLNFLSSCLVASFVQVAVMLIIFVGMFLQMALGYSPLKAGLLLLPMVVTGFAFSNIGGYWADKYGARLPLLFGTGSICLGFMVTLLLFNTVTYYTLLPLLILSGIGMFMISGPVRVALLTETPQDQHGMTNAILTGMRSIISVTGFSITGAIIVNIQFHQAKSTILALIPSVTSEQLQGLMGLLSQTDNSQFVLSQFSPELQIAIKTSVLTAYTNGFYWSLIFVGILQFISLILALFFINKNVTAHPVRQLERSEGSPDEGTAPHPGDPSIRSGRHKNNT